MSSGESLLVRAERRVKGVIQWACNLLLVAMVLFTTYTVVMRYVFMNPPFWGDTVTLFANVWFVLIAFALATWDREHIAMEALYDFLPSRAVGTLRAVWDVTLLLLGVFLLWYGYQAAERVPGRFWELGGLPKQYPMLVLPVAGALVTLAALVSLGRRVQGTFTTDSAGEASAHGEARDH